MGCEGHKEREIDRGRERERNKKNETEQKKYQIRDTWTQCQVMTL